MFTIRQNTTFGLTKSGLKWENLEKAKELPQMNSSSIDAKIQEARVLLD
jgi:hypothetical protein